MITYEYNSYCETVFQSLTVKSCTENVIRPNNGENTVILRTIPNVLKNNTKHILYLLKENKRDRVAGIYFTISYFSTRLHMYKTFNKSIC